MFCPVCGKEVPSGSNFCPHCGSSITVQTATENTQVEWEYGDFAVEMKPIELMGTVGNMVSYSDIIQHTWAEIRPELLNKLQAWLDNGWELVTPLGPDCMTVETKNAGLFGGMKVYLKEVSLKMRRRK